MSMILSTLTNTHPVEEQNAKFAQNYKTFTVTKQKYQRELWQIYKIQSLLQLLNSNSSKSMYLTKHGIRFKWCQIGPLVAGYVE